MNAIGTQYIYIYTCVYICIYICVCVVYTVQYIHCTITPLHITACVCDDKQLLTAGASCEVTEATLEVDECGRGVKGHN